MPLKALALCALPLEPQQCERLIMKALCLLAPVPEGINLVSPALDCLSPASACPRGHWNFEFYGLCYVSTAHEGLSLLGYGPEDASLASLCF